jgi:hypothetical protein
MLVYLIPGVAILLSFHDSQKIHFPVPDHIFRPDSLTFAITLTVTSALKHKNERIPVYLS